VSDLLEKLMTKQKFNQLSIQPANTFQYTNQALQQQTNLPSQTSSKPT